MTHFLWQARLKEKVDSGAKKRGEEGEGERKILSDVVGSHMVNSQGDLWTDLVVGWQSGLQRERSKLSSLGCVWSCVELVVWSCTESSAK